MIREESVIIVEEIVLEFKGCQETISLGKTVEMPLDKWEEAIKDVKLFACYNGKNILKMTALIKQSHLPIEIIDEIANNIMDVIRGLLDMDTDSDEDDQFYTCVHNIVRNVYEETEFVGSFENIADGVEMINRLHQDNAPDISKKEFAADLHFSDQTPFYKAEAAVRQFIGDEE